MTDERKDRRLGLGEITSVFRRFLTYISSDRRVFTLCCIMVLISSAMLLAGPPLLAYVTKLIEDNLGNVPLDQITKISILLIALYVASTVIQMICNRKIAKITCDMMRTIRNDINRKTDRLSVESLRSMSKGNIISLAMNDCDLITNSLHDIVVLFISAATMIVGTTVLMLLTDWRLALATIVLSTVCVVVIYLKIEATRKYFHIQQKDLARLTAFVTENYETNRIVNLYGEKENSMRTFSGINGSLKKSVWRTSSLANITMPLVSFSMYVITAIVAIYASYLMSQGEIGLPILVAFILYVNMFFNPILKLSNVMIMVESAFAGALRIFDYLDKDEMPYQDDHGDLERKGHVELRNVCFGYSNEDVIHDFSLDVMPGQKIAIVGETGAGKTTLVNLLMRFYDIRDGDILIDSVSINDMSRKEVHSLFCMVLQDTWVFNGTIRDNVVFCHENVTDEDVKRVCDAVGLSDYIRSTPQGYDTVIDNKTSLSEGQRQQLTLARAMLDRSPMLILDEATASIDTKMESRIQKVMEGLTVNRTSFVIAHRLSTVRDADVIVVMDRGRIVEMGRHDDLLAKDGLYKDIYLSQFMTHGPE